MYAQDLSFDSINDNLWDAFLQKHGNLQRTDRVTVARAVHFNGCRYSEDEAVILGYDYEGDRYTFGIILHCVHVLNKVALICRKANTIFNEHYHAYEVANLSPKRVYVEIENLLDYHPLGTYHVDGKLFITLHHYVPEY